MNERVISTSTASKPAGFPGYAGPVVRCKDEGPEAVFIVHCGEHHLNGENRIHGGFLMSLAATALRDMLSARHPGMTLQTLSLNCDFLSAGAAGSRLEARAHVTRTTRSVLFAACRLSDGERLLLTASGVYGIEPQDKKGDLS